MPQFLPAQIDLLGRQVEMYAAQQREHADESACQEVEELISIYVSLSHEMEKTIARQHAAKRAEVEFTRQWTGLFSQHVQLGEKLLKMIRTLKALELEVNGVDDFMRALLHSRVGADAEKNEAAFAAVDRGEILTHRLAER